MHGYMVAGADCRQHQAVRKRPNSNRCDPVDRGAWKLFAKGLPAQGSDSLIPIARVLKHETSMCIRCTSANSRLCNHLALGDHHSCQETQLTRYNSDCTVSQKPPPVGEGFETQNGSSQTQTNILTWHKHAAVASHSTNMLLSTPAFAAGGLNDKRPAFSALTLCDAQTWIAQAVDSRIYTGTETCPKGTAG